MKTYILREENNKLSYSEAVIVDSPSALKIIDHPIRLEILKMLAKKPMYPAEIARKMKLHEQKIYYHIKQMTNSGVLEVVEKEEIRGTVAKKLSPKFLNFAFTLSKKWKKLDNLIEKKDPEILNFLNPFIINKELNAAEEVGGFFCSALSKEQFDWYLINDKKYPIK